MMCTACSYENNRQTRFCVSCGESLATIDPSAGDAIVANGQSSPAYSGSVDICAAALAQKIHALGALRASVANASERRGVLDIGEIRLAVGGPCGSRIAPANGPAGGESRHDLAEPFCDLPSVDVRHAAATAIWQAFDAGASVVRVESASGGGATTLLHLLARAADRHGFTNGAFLVTDTRGPATDVAQRLAALLDPAFGSHYYTAVDRGRLADARRSLFLLDRASLNAADTAQLGDLLPDAKFVVVNALAPAQVPTVALGALDPQAVITLLESSYQRPIDIDNRRIALDLCATLGSLPGPTRLLGVAARRLGRSFISLRLQFATGDTIVGRLIASLPEIEQRIVGILALARAPLAAHHIAYIVRSGEIHACLENLIACELVYRCGANLYEVPRHVAQLVPPLADADAAFVRIVDVVSDAFDSWHAVPVLDRQLCAAEQLVTDASDRSNEDLVLKLGLPLAEMFALRGAFGAWGRVLETLEAAATRVPDAAALSRARHELGVRALLLAEHDRAFAYLESAARERQTAGDQAGAAATTELLELADREAPALPKPPASAPEREAPPEPVFGQTSSATAAAIRLPIGARTLFLLGLSIAAVLLFALSLQHRPNTAPAITHFAANPITVAGGQTAQLCVDATDAAVVEIFPNAARLPGSGKHCLDVRPAVSTTYVAVGTADDGQQVHRSVTVAVAQMRMASGLQISAFSVTPARIKAGQAVRLCYAVTGAHRLRIVPRIGDLTRLRSCRSLTLREPHRYRYLLSATGENGSVAQRVVHVDVIASAKPPAGDRTAVDAARARRAVYQFDATPSIVERGQATSLCVGVERPARGFVTHVGPLEPGITRCYRVQPRITTVYRLYIAFKRSTVVQRLTVAVRPATRGRQVARDERR